MHYQRLLEAELYALFATSETTHAVFKKPQNKQTNEKLDQRAVPV